MFMRLPQAVEEAIRCQVDELREEVASDYVDWATLSDYVKDQVEPSRLLLSSCVLRVLIRP